MDRKLLISKLDQAIKNTVGDDGRNHYLIKRIKQKKELLKSDKKYIERILEIKIDKISDDDSSNISNDKTKQFFPNLNLAKCTTCNNEIKLEDKSIRDNHKWYHSKCFQKSIIRKHSTPISETIENRKKKSGKDPIQFLLTGIIFVFLITTVYFILGHISMIAMGLGGAITIYHITGASGKIFSKNVKGKKAPSVFLLFLLGSPFLIATMIAYEGYTLLESPVRIILLWAMTISFWSTMLFVPMAVLSKYREDIQEDVKSYPKISIIIPAFNEEKVIKNTIEGLLETKYPKKEIIFVDDGSTDKTLEIASEFKDQIKVLHKENGGKASALNYGLVYSSGEIIVIVDADTIIGRNSLKEIVKGFEIDEHVAAVAGNIKVRNRVNWITKCQALEYITGIQIVRRAFDIFGSITIVPGALGAFKKSLLTEAGAYGKETIVEDFDQTIKLLKAGLVTQGSSKATAYTEAPNSFRDFFAQRKRWYRGNIQVLKRHSDALTNPRFGYLQRLSLPYLFLGMVITPIIGYTALANAILGIILGDWLYVLQISLIFTVVHYLMSALAIRIDDEDPKLLWYAGFLVFGFKQIVDAMLLKAIIEHLQKKRATWTSAKRIGV
ncbi:MAG: glycosyltransferase [Nitrosopumilus sp.]|uniref:glycosyltransferase family 2 protein n=1 Tax=Nitrosopumilus sp. TaxID=2024843 RepID=UPI00247B69E1|nr:glycosyltransferase family 2 protein [Nitrosopumilus sp.]MCV0392219.1 glycosyltransferase [Nitrosopumilus sp.]